MLRGKHAKKDSDGRRWRPVFGRPRARARTRAVHRFLGACLATAAVGACAAAVALGAPSGPVGHAIGADSVATPAALAGGLQRFQRHGAVRASGIALRPSKTRPYWACPTGVCDAIVDPPPVRASGRWSLPAGGPELEGGGEKGGYAPTELRSAYRIPATAPTPANLTIAIVDSYGDKSAESDLAKYREKYGLPACTHAGGCFSKVNRKGEEANYPPAQSEVSGSQNKELVKGWEGETSVDLDMASAACGQCHILLVQAGEPSVEELAAGENVAASLGAKVISNSYGEPEGECSECESYASDYDHPGVEILASAGDRGYDNDYEKQSSPSFPATAPYVVAVGGTSLKKAAGARGWTESVWNEKSRELGTGGGCSLTEPKPVWQKDKGCTKRTDNDVAAVGACETPVSVYSTAYSGWEDFCGTSVASPLVAGIMAHASEHIRSEGAHGFYEDPASVFAVTTGTNGTCSVEYLCNAAKSESGYNGPTGLGTPDGVPYPHPAVSSVAPSSGPAAGHTTVTIAGAGFEEVGTVRFGSTAAQSFTVKSETEISAVSPAGTGTVNVTVTTPAGETATTEGDHFTYKTGPQFALEIPATELDGTPGGLALNASGDVWVSFVESGELQEFSPSGALVREVGPALAAPCTGALSESVGLAVQSNNDLLVTDRQGDRVLELSSTGVCQSELDAAGTGEAQLSTPQGIAVSPKSGDIFVADAGDGCVDVFSETGAFIRQFPIGLGQWTWGVAVSASGDVYATNMLGRTDSVLEYSETGERLGTIAAPGREHELFEFPAGVAIGAGSKVFVANWLQSAVQAFSPANKYLYRFGYAGSEREQLALPFGVAVNSGGEAWVAEMGYGRVEKWTGAE